CPPGSTFFFPIARSAWPLCRSEPKAYRSLGVPPRRAGPTFQSFPNATRVGRHAVTQGYGRKADRRGGAIVPLYRGDLARPRPGSRDDIVSTSHIRHTHASGAHSPEAAQTRPVATCNLFPAGTAWGARQAVRARR